jgi:hypothetical protein
MKKPWAVMILLLAPVIASAQTTITASGNSVTTVPNAPYGVTVSAAGATPDISVLTGNASTSAFHIFNSTGAERLLVRADGFIGIGTSLPLSLVDIRGSNSSGAASTGQLALSSNDPMAADKGGQLIFGYNYTGTTNGGLASISGRKENGIDGNYSTYMAFATVASGEPARSEKMRITSAGNVGLGTSAPLDRLDIRSPNSTGAASTGQLALSSSDSMAADKGGQLIFGYSYQGTTTGGLASISGRKENGVDGNYSTYLAFATVASGEPARSEKVRIDSAGRVGIGTTAPTSLLQIGSMYPTRFLDAISSGIPNGQVLEMAGSSEIHVSGLQIGTIGIPSIQSTGGTKLYLNQSMNQNVVIGSSSLTGMGLQVDGQGLSTFAKDVTVGGDLNVVGNLSANYQDVAEWVPASEHMPAGTVVVLQPDVTNTVMPSRKAYDTSVAGVVSAQPGLLLGIGSASKAKIATTGRVKVRVDAGQHPVRVGDLLSTSDKPGTAMFSEPLDLGGVRIHRPGTIIGKALEPLAQGEGEILVLLSLQ